MDSEFLFLSLTVLFKLLFSAKALTSRNFPTAHIEIMAGFAVHKLLQFFAQVCWGRTQCRKASVLFFSSECHYTIFLPGCIAVIIAGIVRMARNAMDDLLGCVVTV